MLPPLTPVYVPTQLHLARCLDPLCPPDTSRTPQAWAPFWFFPSQGRLVPVRAPWSARWCCWPRDPAWRQSPGGCHLRHSHPRERLPPTTAGRVWAGSPPRIRRKKAAAQMPRGAGVRGQPASDFPSPLHQDLLSSVVHEELPRVSGSSEGPALPHHVPRMLWPHLARA